MVFVSKISWSSGDTAPTEDIEFVYGAIQFVYNAQSAKGDLKEAGRAEWSQVLNTADYEVAG